MNLFCLLFCFSQHAKQIRSFVFGKIYAAPILLWFYVTFIDLILQLKSVSEQLFLTNFYSLFIFFLGFHFTKGPIFFKKSSNNSIFIQSVQWKLPVQETHEKTWSEKRFWDAPVFFFTEVTRFCISRQGLLEIKQPLIFSLNLNQISFPLARKLPLIGLKSKGK